MNSRVSQAVNLAQNEPKVPDNNPAKRPQSISIRDEIERRHDHRQIHCGKSDPKKEGNWRGAVLLGPQVN